MVSEERFHYPLENVFFSSRTGYLRKTGVTENSQMHYLWKVKTVNVKSTIEKEIINLELRPHEYISYLKEPRISLFRMDFSARIRDTDGTEHLVIIELQKTWLTTETLRFRQYPGTQYLSKIICRAMMIPLTPSVSLRKAFLYHFFVRKSTTVSLVLPFGMRRTSK